MVLASATLLFNLLQQCQRRMIIVSFEQFPDVIDIGVNQEQLVQAASAIAIRLSDTIRFLRKKIPKTIALARVIDISPQLYCRIDY